MRRAISLAALKQSRLPRITSAGISSNDIIRQPEGYVLSRRKALGLAGMITLVAAPAAAAIEAALSSTFSVQRRGNRISFSVAGVTRWIIDPEMFDGSPSVTYKEHADGIDISLVGAFFPGTTIPADISASIKRGTRPKLRMHLTKLDASFTCDFVQWLLGRESLGGKLEALSLKLEALSLKEWVVGDAKINCAFSECSLRPDWTLSLVGATQAHLPEHASALAATSIQVRLLTSADPTLLVPEPKKHSIVKLSRGNNAWHVPLRVADTEGWTAHASDTAFDSCSIETTSDDRTGVVFEAAGGVYVNIHNCDNRTVFNASNATRESTKLALRNVRYATTRNAQGLHEALVARYSETPTWFTVDGISLELGDREGLAPFEMERRDGTLTRCIVAPGLLRYTIPVDGAITEPTRTHPRTQIALVPKNVSGNVLPKMHAYLAMLQLDFSKSMQITPQGGAAGQVDENKNLKVKKQPNIFQKFKFTAPGNPKVSVIRPDDLLVLTFEFEGITINKSAGTFSSSSKGKLIVHFQPQHIAERAFFYVDLKKYSADKSAEDAQPSTSDLTEKQKEHLPQSSNEPLVEPPIDAVMAQATRLVFDTPGGYSGQYSTEGLLDWSKFTQRVSPSAKPPDPGYAYSKIGSSFISKFNGSSLVVQNSKPAVKTKTAFKASTRGTYALSSGVTQKVPTADKSLVQQFEGNSDFVDALPSSVLAGYLAALEGNPPIRTPLDDETAIEYPYRLILSPNKYAGWAHSALAKRDDNGRTELWHSRLGVRHSDGTVNENAAYFRTMRAIWSPDVVSENDTLANYGMSAVYKERPFRTSLNRRDRHEIVWLTSKYDMKKTKEKPLDVKRFMLTSLGAWADMTGAWDPDGQDYLDVEQWIQRGTQGRDHFVRVCYKGYLFPFGNRATLVKESERKFLRTPRGDMAAYLMQRMYIILREPVREFPANGLAGMKFQGRNFPFRRITITTKVTPNLQLPVQLKAGMSANSFWPKFEVDGAGHDVMWSCIARDWDGKDHNLSTPLAFIANTDATNNAETGAWITNDYEPDIKETERKKVQLNGQKIAFAPSVKMGDTALPTTVFTLSGYYAPDVTQSTPRFFPKMQKSAVAIEKVNELLGTNAQQEISFYDKYLDWAFEKGAEIAKDGAVNLADVKNPSQIFVQLLSDVEMDFGKQTDKAGGLASPSISIGGLSRLLGPIPLNIKEEAGGIANSAVAIGNFDPAQYFGSLLATKILGDITLKDVLGFVTNVMENMDQMPGLDKKDDFGVSDSLKGAVSKEEIGQAIQDIINNNEAIKTAGQKVNDIVNADSDIKEAKQQLEAAISEAKTKLEEIKSAVVGGVADAKKQVDVVLKECKKLVDDKINELKTEVDKLIGPLKEAGNEAYKKYEEVTGALEELKKGLQLVYEWSTKIKKSPGDILEPMLGKDAVLYLKAEFKKGLDAKPPEVLIFGSLTNFIVNLIGKGSATFLIVKFNKIAVSAKAGEKPDVDVDFESVEFAGPLKFVNKLKDLIPSGGGAGGVGFSFDFDILPTGITASLTITLPNVTVGVFSLMNMSFLMRIKIPFNGDPFSSYFAFCTRDNPFRLTVMMFAGGGFFGIEITPQGVNMLEAAFEFGGNFAFDCGVASGGASVMAGVYYKMEMKTVEGYEKKQQQSELTGYFRLTGNLSILGIIRVSLLFELKLTWQSNGKVWGTATIEVDIEILFLSFSVGVTVERQLKGSDADPTFVDMFSASQWEQYCLAYA